MHSRSKRSRAHRWASLPPKQQRLPLLAVLVACAIGQAAILVQRPLIFQSQDSVQYLSLARAMLTSHHFVDPLRTPGYPAFMALIFALTGGEHLGAVVAVQVALMICAVLEIYVLVNRLYRRPWIAALIASAAALNPLMTNWERTILTETLCYWLIVTLFLFFERYLATGRNSTLVWFALLSTAAILTRPQFIYLPALALIVLAVRSIRLGDLRRRWRTLAAVCAVAYVPILACVGVNALTAQYVGLSSVANLNLFGKMIEFRMYQLPDSGGDPQLAHFQSDVQTFMRTTHEKTVLGQVWSFVHTHPEYDAQYWATYGRYSTQLTWSHPLSYLQQTGPDVLKAWLAAPESFTPMPYMPSWIAGLILFSICVAASYFLLPLLLVTSAVQAWRHPEQAASVMALALLLLVAGNIVISGVTDFVEFSRLRFPVDWAMVLILTARLVEWTPALAKCLLLARGRAAIR